MQLVPSLTRKGWILNTSKHLGKAATFASIHAHILCTLLIDEVGGTTIVNVCAHDKEYMGTRKHHGRYVFSTIRVKTIPKMNVN